MEKQQLKEGSIEKSEQIGNEQLYDIMTGDQVSWQAIIYDLINTEQLDPWNIDLSILAKKYLEKIRQLEETNFFVSSEVLLAASILLRLKSEFLLYKYMKSVDEILFGKKEEPHKPIEKIEIDEDELPVLYPKTPLPRYRRVSLQELMDALNKAITTESRRIKKQVEKVQQEKETEIVLPKARISIKDRIRKLYSTILTKLKKKQTKISYTEIVGKNKEDRISCFLPCLHLDNQQKLFLEQEAHFDEIWLWLYKHYKKLNPTPDFETDEEEKLHEETGFDNPLANFFDTRSEIMKGDF